MKKFLFILALLVSSVAFAQTTPTAKITVTWEGYSQTGTYFIEEKQANGTWAKLGDAGAVGTFVTSQPWRKGSLTIRVGYIPQTGANPLYSQEASAVFPAIAPGNIKIEIVLQATVTVSS